MVLGPVPRMAQELLAGEVRLLDSLGLEFGHHLGFGGDGGVVGAGNPAGIFTLHARAAHEDVLNRLVEHMAHMEHARDVGRRNHDGIRLAAIRFGMKQAVLHPVVIPFVLHLGGIVFRSKHDVVSWLNRLVLRLQDTLRACRRRERPENCGAKLRNFCGIYLTLPIL